MYYKEEMAEAMRSKVMVTTRERGSADPVLQVWEDGMQVTFRPRWGVDAGRSNNIAVHVWSMNPDEQAFPCDETTFIGYCDKSQIGKLIRILGACSPRYMSYALRHAGIMEHEEYSVCHARHAPAASHLFWRDIT